MRRRLQGILVLASALWIGCGSDGGGIGTGGQGTCAPVELVIDGVPAVENPFDPAQADVQVTFTGPDASEWTTPAFYYRAYERMLVGGFERLGATADGQWRARFTPPRPGTWRWTASVRINGAPVGQGPAGELRCARDPSSHGLLRRSDSDPRYLAWEDGTPHLSVGENLCWYDGRGTFAYDDWLDKLAAHHANWIRLWMPSWAFGLEWIRRNPDGTVAETTLGNYTARLDRAWQLDHVIEAARQRGMVVMLAIQNHGAFSLTSNSEWADNPYNAANGGPLGRPHDLYTNDEALTLFERRLRYIVARWGYAPNVIWEFWNEVDLADAQPAADVIAWHARMGRVLRLLDPYDHLVTTSVAFQIGPGGTISPSWLPLWNLPEIDLAQIHLYGIGTALQFDFSTMVPLMTQGLVAATGKPVLLGEAGVDFRGPAETLASDPEHRGLHDIIWSGVFGGGSGTGMTWWWDNLIDPQDQYGQLDGIWRLTDGVAWDREGFVADASSLTLAAPDAELRVLALVGERAVLAWIRHADHLWFRPQLAAVTGATVQISGLTGAGSWRITWLDPLTAAVLGESTARAAGGIVTLEVPQFNAEIALRMDAD